MMLSTTARNNTLLGAALLLSVVPLPQAVGPWQPPWLAVALIWVVLASPAEQRLLLAAAAGLLYDLLSGAPLGLHAMAAAMMTFVASSLRDRMLSSPPWQRFLLALAALGAYLGLVALIGGWFGQPGSPVGFASSLLSGGILILVAFLFLKD